MLNIIKKTMLILIAFIALLSLILFAFAPHPPSVPAAVASTDELDAYLQKLTQANDPPSLSVVVVKENEVVYNKAFGIANPTTQAPATPDTVYHWWSMTKLFTAVSILQLQEQGKLHLDDPVTDTVPFFIVEDKNGENPTITIRQLLNHTSGLPDTMPQMIGWVHTSDDLVNQTELLRTQLPTFNKLKFAPGTDSAYTNLGYIVLGAVIESVSEQSYESYVVENILQPLQMNQTNYIYTPEMQQNEATGSHPIVNMFTPFLPFLLDMDTLIQSREGNRYWLERIYIDATPPTGLIGSTNDAVYFMNAYLNDGQGEFAQILTPESIEMMMPTGDAVSERPLGWAEFESDGRFHIQHRGGGPGFATIMRLYPDENLGITILANGTNLD
ncbi:MAG: serine hydrolase, partial [Chloroflexi bacterium]|nr:serine hydrolase [Chloroflexota bacterium]